MLSLFIVFILSISVAHWSTNYSANQKIISGAFYLVHARAWELILGVAAAFILFEKSSFSKLSNSFFSSLGIILILISIFTFNENTAFPSLLTLIPTLGTMLVIIFSSRETIVYKLLSIPFLVKIGLISYSIYLWHQPILAFSREIFGYDLTTISLILLLILSGIFGFLSWRFIEKPFRDKSFLSQRKVFGLTFLQLFLL